MAMTTYDEIWSCFLDNVGKYSENLPKENSEIYRLIHNAVRDYNIKTDEDENKLTFIDETEIVNQELDDNRLKLLALLLKKNILQNDLEYFQEVYQYDLKEVKSKFYKNQVDGRTDTINKVEREILEILTYMDDRDFS